MAEDLTPERLRELSILLPIRCYTCRKVLANKQVPYEELIREGVHPGTAMTRLGIERVCCRMNVLSPTVLPMGLQVRQVTPEVPTLRLRQELAQLQLAPGGSREVSGALGIMQSNPSIARREFKTGPGSISAPRVYRTQLIGPSRTPAPAPIPSVNVNALLQALEEEEGPALPISLGPVPATARALTAPVSLGRGEPLPVHHLYQLEPNYLFQLYLLDYLLASSIASPSSASISIILIMKKIKQFILDM